MWFSERSIDFYYIINVVVRPFLKFILVDILLNVIPTALINSTKLSQRFINSFYHNRKMQKNAFQMDTYFTKLKDKENLHCRSLNAVKCHYIHLRYTTYVKNFKNTGAIKKLQGRVKKK